MPKLFEVLLFIEKRNIYTLEEQRVILKKLKAANARRTSISPRSDLP